MLYLFYGEDQDKARAKWRAVINAFQTKHPAGAIFRSSAEDFNSGQFEELLTAGDLFGEKRLIAGDKLLENPAALEFIENRIADLIASPNTFLLLEINLPAALVKQISQTGGKVEEFELLLRSTAAPFNLFSLSDALLARDRKRLWLQYQKALLAGVAEEEIFWKLVWPVKTMLVVAKQTEELKTVKPFTAQKSKRGLEKFTVAELEKLSGDLAALWHDTRRGLVDFAIGLERLVLAI